MALRLTHLGRERKEKRRKIHCFWVYECLIYRNIIRQCFSFSCTWFISLLSFSILWLENLWIHRDPCRHTYIYSLASRFYIVFKSVAFLHLMCPLPQGYTLRYFCVTKYYMFEVPLAVFLYIFNNMNLWFSCIFFFFFNELSINLVLVFFITDLFLFFFSFHSGSFQNFLFSSLMILNFTIKYIPMFFSFWKNYCC